MAEESGEGFWDIVNRNTDTDIIEVDFSPQPNVTNASERRAPGLIPPEHLPGLGADPVLEGNDNPQRESRQHIHRQRHHHHHRRHHHHHHHRHSRRHQQPSAVIDLTEEPDSPHEVQASQPQSRSGSNPRRTHSQRISPPTLARSDGTLSRSNMPEFIDLTVDSPEDDRPPAIPISPLPRARAPSLRPHQSQNQNQNHRHSHDSLIRVGLVQGASSRIDFRGFGRRLAGILSSDIMSLGFNGPPQFDIAHVAHQESERSSPKPPREATPPTREGFTRNTCAEPEDDRIVVCPCCSEELAYDPLGGQVAGTKKRRRAPGEHHFWALKKCGHVYCADCFENRRPTKANRNGVGFPGPVGKDPYSVPNELHCAVEGCGTKVAPKGEWVGLYM